MEPLTRRQAQVMSMIAAGYTNGQIADAMVIEPKTVKNHVNRLHAKLGARDRAALIACWPAVLARWPGHPGLIAMPPPPVPIRRPRSSAPVSPLRPEHSRFTRPRQTWPATGPEAA